MRMAVALYRAVFARAIFHGLNKALFRLSASGLGLLNSDNADVSGETHLIEILLPRLLAGRPSPVMLDVGANAGSYSRSLSARFPSATIHAFEPHPRSFERLAALNLPNVKCHNIALGEADARLALYDYAEHVGSEHASLYPEVMSDLRKHVAVSVDVPVRRLDAVAASEHIDFIDFMKIDTEGGEKAVLVGASGLLERGAVGCIHFEFNEMNIVSRTFLRDFRKLLARYVFFRLLPGGVLKLNDNPFMTELFAYQNILAVPQDKAALVSR